VVLISNKVPSYPWCSDKKVNPFKVDLITCRVYFYFLFFISISSCALKKIAQALL
jgi:hypothetical protein